MKKEDKFIRAAVSAELFEAIKKDSKGDTPADTLKAILYPHYNIRQPKPPTPEQRRILSSLANMRTMVKQGFLEQSAYEAAKAKAYKDYDIEVDDDEQDEVRSDTEGIDADDENTESSVSDEPVKVEKPVEKPTQAKPTQAKSSPAKQTPQKK